MSYACKPPRLKMREVPKNYSRNRKLCKLLPTISGKPIRWGWLSRVYYTDWA